MFREIGTGLEAVPQPKFRVLGLEKHMTVQLTVTEFYSSVGIMWLVCSLVTWTFGFKLGNYASVTPALSES